jgi:uncharacterized protein with beta-barrel porin domain
MECMPFSLRRSRAARHLRGLAWTIALALLFAFGTGHSAQAQSRTPRPTGPSPTPSLIASDLSAAATVSSLGSDFLERLGNQSTSGFERMLRSNPGGGGASEAAEAPQFRNWFEGYGIVVRNRAVGDFVGDSRKTFGGVAGFGARIGPGVNIGFSVDQSRTDVDVPLALQSAGLDLTQLGFNASVDKGPWTWAVALVHGFADIHSRRDTGLGVATAGYNARVDGALTELSYYVDHDQSRIVPKAGLEYVRARTGAFQEFGGLDPIVATDATVERMRVLVGAEVGHYWIIDQKLFDVSYGKFVDNVVQNFGDVTVSLGAQSLTLQGIGESQYGADAGASASLGLSNTARLYVNYDGKFRAAMQSHQGTLGLELKW